MGECARAADTATPACAAGSYSGPSAASCTGLRWGRTGTACDRANTGMAALMRVLVPDLCAVCAMLIPGPPACSKGTYSALGASSCTRTASLKRDLTHAARRCSVAVFCPDSCWCVRTCACRVGYPATECPQGTWNDQQQSVSISACQGERPLVRRTGPAVRRAHSSVVAGMAVGWRGRLCLLVQRAHREQRALH